MVMSINWPCCACSSTQQHEHLPNSNLLEGEGWKTEHKGKTGEGKGGTAKGKGEESNTHCCWKDVILSYTS